MNLVLRGIGLLPRRWIKKVSALQWRHPALRAAFEMAANTIRNRDGEIQQGVARGLRFNTGGSVAGFMLGTTEPELQCAFELFVRPKMTVFDIGANVGFYSVLSARLVTPLGKVVAFDPLDSNARQIRYNANLNRFANIDVQELALGRVDGQAEFMVSANSNWGMLSSVGRPPGHVATRTVRLAKLDTLLAEHALPPPGLMKMDVEGAEVDVLDGAKETLAKHRPVLLIDLHGTNARIAEQLAEAGYEARVIGGGRTALGEAHWAAEVVAVPRERGELLENLERIAQIERVTASA